MLTSPIFQMVFSVDFPSPLFKALPLNTRGTDFFVGDIHGHYRRLAQALEEVGFCPSHDRLICTGDLVDRGEESDVASDWLEQPFFHSVRGNHEGLYLTWRLKARDRQEQEAFEEEMYFRNGGRWVQNTPETEHKRLEQYLEKLPYFLAVPSADGRTVGVVHAELPDGITWPSLLTAFPAESLLETMLWGRDRLKYAIRKERGLDLGELSAPEDHNTIAGLDALVCGHAVVPDPYRLGNILYVDTAGWKKKGHFSVVRLQDVLRRTTPAA